MKLSMRLGGVGGARPGARSRTPTRCRCAPRRRRCSCSRRTSDSPADRRSPGRRAGLRAQSALLRGAARTVAVPALRSRNRRSRSARRGGCRGSGWARLQTPASWGWTEQPSESVMRSVAQGQPEAQCGSATWVIRTSGPATRLRPPSTRALPRKKSVRSLLPPPALRRSYQVTWAVPPSVHIQGMKRRPLPPPFTCTAPRPARAAVGRIADDHVLVHVVGGVGREGRVDVVGVGVVHRHRVAGQRVAAGAAVEAGHGAGHFGDGRHQLREAGLAAEPVGARAVLVHHHVVAAAARRRRRTRPVPRPCAA